MTDYRTLVRDAVLQYEGGRIPYMYLDNRRLNGQPAPLVTVGIGCAIGRPEALTLAFELLGKPATPFQIGQAYDEIAGAPFGRVATFYEKLTDVRLPDDAIDYLQDQRFDVMVAGIQRVFPEYMDYPDTAKAGILELVYGIGVAGLQKYPNFRAAVARKDWKTAAEECASNASDPAYAARNANRRQWFLEEV